MKKTIKKTLGAMLAVIMVLTMSIPAFAADSVAIENPAGGKIKSFEASDVTYDNGKATFSVTLKYAGGDAKSGELSWSGEEGNVSYTDLKTTSTGNDKNTTSTFTVDQVCESQVITFKADLDDANGTDKIATTTVTIEGLGHDYEWVVAKEASCTEDGLMEYQCAKCGDVLETEVIPATGHDYVLSATASSTNLQNSTKVTITVNGACAICGDTAVLANQQVSLKQNGTQTVNIGGYSVTVVVNGNNKITSISVK